MLAVHALWSAACGLGLWAEDSELAVKSSSQALRTARPHPFAAPAEALTHPTDAQHGTTTLVLPSLRSAPLDSPDLVRVTPRPTPRTSPALLPWSVPVAWFEPAAALRVLDEPDRELRHGPSFAWFTELAAFAKDLVDRRRALPALAREDAEPVAKWRPVLQGPDVGRSRALISAMPPVCRAEQRGGNETDPHLLALTALTDLVDAVQRRRLAAAGTVLVPPRRGRRPRRLPASEAFLEALVRPVGRFDAEPVDVDALEAELSRWAQTGTGEAGPARATFRLTPPPEDEADAASDAHEPWRLDFLLQSAEDPSLLVPADQVWEHGTGLRRWLERPQELLLAELGRATRVYPELKGALDHARPSGLELDAEDAFAFLSTGADLLHEAGFGVLLPSWWDRRAGVGLKLSATTPVEGVVAKGGAFSRKELVKFRWQLAVGTEALTEEEIDALVAAKAPLVRLRGQWVAVDPEQLRRGLDFLRRKPTGKKRVEDILRLAATHPEDADTPLPLAGVEADGWLGHVLDGTLERSLEPLPAPPGLQAQLRPYQQRGLSWLSFLSSLGLGACLADDMGLGKTIQLLALECRQRAEEPTCGPTLLVCPMSLVGNWQHEAARFTPHLRVYAHHGGERLRGKYLTKALKKVDLVVTTYATATRDIEELATHEWHRVVLDEAQAIKNSLSRSSTAVRRLSARHRVTLTGTPVENRLAEMWSIMDFVNPGMLGSSEQFRTRYAIPVERHGQTEPAQRLRRVTRPYLLRRLKTDPTIIDDLPEKIEVNQYCRLTTEQASLYQTVVDDMMDKIEGSEGIQRRGNVLAALAKLKQVCNHPAQLLHDRSPIGRRSGKVQAIEEILGEIVDEGDKALCFTQYTEFAEMLLPHLSVRLGCEVFYLHGGTPKKRRDQLVRQFQGASGPAIFLLSLKAGGTGLNLTAANHVLHLDRWWNPAVENQATDRAFRIGQRRNVQVRKFVCTGTLEEKIDRMIEEKKALADLVISDGEGWLTELSTNSLRDLFALSAEAVDE